MRRRRRRRRRRGKGKGKGKRERVRRLVSLVCGEASSREWRHAELTVDSILNCDVGRT
jgi:hypothetical protein